MMAERRRATGRRRTAAPRRTLFDTLAAADDRNVFCERKSLVNEASVETFFVNRLIKDLDYRDNQIKTKQSIKELTVSLGGAKGVKYKPDYVFMFRGKPRWVIDAKHPDEDLDKWVAQCSGYCLGLNQQFKGENPVGWFMLTNGIESRVYEWDHHEPILVIPFADFTAANPNYEELRSLFSAGNIVHLICFTQSETTRFVE